MKNVIIYNQEIFAPTDYHIFSCAEAPWKHIHAHDFYEFAYVYESSGTHYTADGDSKVKTGSMIFITPGIWHCTVSENEKHKVRVCNCLFKREFFNNSVERVFNSTEAKNTPFYKKLTAAPMYLILNDTSDEVILNIIKLAKHEYELGKFCRPEIIAHYLDILLLETARTLSSHNVQRQNHDIDNLIKYIKMNINMKLTLPFLAEQVHLSPDYLSRYFKKCTGKTISEFLSEQRIEKAMQLLRTTELSVSEIGYCCGYSSDSNFRKYFTKLAGISPREYRRQQISI